MCIFFRGINIRIYTRIRTSYTRVRVHVRNINPKITIPKRSYEFTMCEAIKDEALVLQSGTHI